MSLFINTVLSSGSMSPPEMRTDYGDSDEDIPLIYPTPMDEEETADEDDDVIIIEED